MKKTFNFLVRWRRGFFVAGLFSLCLLLAGCAVPGWIGDAQALIPVLETSVLAVLAFIALLSGNPVMATALNAVQAIIADVNSGLLQIENLITQYKATPNETILQQIEDVANLVSANLSSILSIAGLPVAVATKLQQWAQLVLSQLEAWLAILPAIKLAVKHQNVHELKAPAGDKVMSAATLREKLHAILIAPTGDPAVDAAAAKAFR